MSTAPGLPTRTHDAYLFDLDGTIYLGEELLPGAQRLIVELRRRGIPLRFLSNNPTRSPQQYADKLTRLGLPNSLESVWTGTVFTVLLGLLLDLTFAGVQRATTSKGLRA